MTSPSWERWLQFLSVEIPDFDSPGAPWPYRNSRWLREVPRPNFWQEPPGRHWCLGSQPGGQGSDYSVLGGRSFERCYTHYDSLRCLGQAERTLWRKRTAYHCSSYSGNFSCLIFRWNAYGTTTIWSPLKGPHSREPISDAVIAYAMLLALPDSYPALRTFWTAV